MIRTAGIEVSGMQRIGGASAGGVAIQRDFQYERISKILEAINSGRPSNVRTLADDLNLSESYIRHFFKNQTGFRLSHLLVEQRLQRAAQLLKNSNMRIKEIACAAGYEHTSSFIRAFERRFHQAPLAYRRLCIAENANK